DLNERDIRGPLGGKWRPQRILDIITNEKYLGNALLQKHFRNNHIEKKKTVNRGELPKYYAEDTHKGILDKQTFTQANEVLNRLHELKLNRTKPTLSVFTGKIRCPFCGKKYKRIAYHGCFGWNCSTYQTQGKSACFGKRIPEDTIKMVAADVLGLTEFSEDVFTTEILYIDVPEPNQMLFVFRNGNKTTRIWEDRSRATSWTPEMRERARQKTISQRGKNKCQK
ncbi:MAG: recombinase family protein, partial [Saccharofermentanales bacterium]